MLERRLERYFAERIKSLGGECIKLTSIVGLPDRLVLLPGGRTFFVEFKAPKGKTRAVQGFIHRRLKSLGFSVYVIYNKDYIEEVCRLWSLNHMPISREL